MDTIGIIIGIVFFLLGLMICFVGEKWSKVVVFFVAFIAVFYLMNSILGNVENENTRFIICAAVGLVSGILTLFVYNWAPLIIGAGVGVIIAMNFDFGLEIVRSSQTYYYLYIIIVAVICALLCMAVKAVMIKIVTGLCGGALIVGTAMYLFNVVFNHISENIADYLQSIFSVATNGSSVTGPIIAALIIGVFGVIVQFGILPSPLHR